MIISENTLYSFFNNPVEGIYQSTPDGHYLIVNPRLAQMYGYDSPTELIHSITDIATQLYVEPDRYQLYIEEIEKNNIVKNFISQIYLKDKTKIWISENARIVREKTGKVVYYEGFVSDITIFKNTEEQIKLQDKQQQQVEKRASIDKMARGFSHDLNNILSPILGYAELLLEYFPKEDNAENYLKNIIKSTKKARNLIKKLHLLGNPDNKKREPLHIISVINEVINHLSTDLPAKIEIEQKIENDLPYILGNPAQIHQILMNTSENAINAMQNTGGVLTIKFKEIFLTVNDIQTNFLNLEPGYYLEIVFRDTGIGIEARNLNKIYDPYFSTKSNGIGHGLGLATVHSLVKSYKGDIKVKSKPGKGTTFNIYLPAYKTEVSTNFLPDDVKNGQTKKHIMLIDDDDDILQIQKQLIEHLGYKVTAFNDSLLALESFSQNPHNYDLILTDMNMPELSGLALSKLMLHINSQIPIILCTGFTDSVNEATLKSVGIKKFVLKPLTTQKLSHDLKSVLNES